MKTITLALAVPAVLASGLAVNAGGYIAPVVESAVAPIVQTAPVSDWQGAYVGATLGYAFNGKDRVGIAQGPDAGVHTIDTLKLSGVNGGLRIGYRWQQNNWVFGPELGYEVGNIEDSFDSVGGYDAQSKIKNVLALRFKTGYLVRPDTQVYGIIGAARAKIDNYYVEGTGDGGPSAIRDSFNRSGYIVGLGAERQINDKWSVTGEYEFANFGKKTINDGAAYTRVTPKYHNVKLGVNFRF